MREAWVIAKREFIERVRSKWFIVMTVLWPVLMVGAIVVPAILGGKGTEGAKVEIVDKSGILGEPIANKLAGPAILHGLGWKTTVVPPDTSETVLRGKIRANEINGYLVISEDALDGGSVVYNGDNASNQTVSMMLTQAVTDVVIRERALKLGLNDAQLISLAKGVDVKARHTTGEEEGTSGGIMFLIGYMIAFLMYVAITIYGVNVMRSIVTEKSDRVVELMVAATKPRSMMSGKIIGVGFAGLVQIAVWFGLAALALAYKDNLLGFFGAKPDPKMALLPTLSTSQLVFTGIYFVLGFLFYSSLYAAVGAMVSSEQDSQQAQMPVTFLLMIGMFAILAVTSDPRGSTASLMTMVPFWSPMLMPLRYFLGGATLGQVGISIGILLVSTLLVVRIAAKIYRVGILMYGKRPSLRELVRWVRY
ncbi:MAG: ABC transporter permease [Kofleriaceae bacterium]|nr:ABC transporter permease [Kofleriaceae bacterium]